MHRSLRSLALVTTMTAALVTTSGCGQETVEDPGTTSATPSPAAAPATAEDEQTTTSAAPTETSTEAAATETAAETSDDEQQSSPALSADPAWTAGGRLLGVYGDVAVFGEGEGTGTTVVARSADGSVAWQRDLAAPEELAGAGDVTALAAPGHRTVRLVWVGTPAAGDGSSLAVTAVLDPATGVDLATGSEPVEAGTFVSDVLTRDQVWLGHDTAGSVLLTVTDDGELTLEGDAHGWNDPVATLPLTHELGVDHVDGLVQLRTLDGPVGPGARCEPMPEGPGGGVVSVISPDRDSAAVFGATVDLVDGSVTCVPVEQDESFGGWEALADDGTLAGTVWGEPSGEACEWCDLEGVVLLRQEGTEVTELSGARPAGFLGDLLLLSTEAGYAAHRVG